MWALLEDKMPIGRWLLSGDSITVAKNIFYLCLDVKKYIYVNSGIHKVSKIRYLRSRRYIYMLGISSCWSWQCLFTRASSLCQNTLIGMSEGSEGSEILMCSWQNP